MAKKQGYTHQEDKCERGAEQELGDERVIFALLAHEEDTGQDGDRVRPEDGAS